METGANAIADSVTQLAEAIVLNYLALHGQEGRFGQDVLPGSALVSQMSQLIAFAKVPSLP